MHTRSYTCVDTLRTCIHTRTHARTREYTIFRNESIGLELQYCWRRVRARHQYRRLPLPCSGSQNATLLRINPTVEDLVAFTEVWKYQEAREREETDSYTLQRRIASIHISHTTRSPLKALMQRGPQYLASKPDLFRARRAKDLHTNRDRSPEGCHH